MREAKSYLSVTFFNSVWLFNFFGWLSLLSGFESLRLLTLVLSSKRTSRSAYFKFIVGVSLCGDSCVVFDFDLSLIHTGETTHIRIGISWKTDNAGSGYAWKRQSSVWRIRSVILHYCS